MGKSTISMAIFNRIFRHFLGILVLSKNPKMTHCPSPNLPRPGSGGLVPSKPFICWERRQRVPHGESEVQTMSRPLQDICIHNTHIYVYIYMYICIYVYIYIFIILYLYFYLFIFRVKKTGDAACWVGFQIWAKQNQGTSIITGQTALRPCRSFRKCISQC